jgi:hypothetical protein
MHLLYCDETNFTKRPGDFFAYGGVVFDAAVAQNLAAGIEEARNALGVPREYMLKFNPGPKNISHQQFIQLKQAVIAAAAKFDCKLLINLLLHDIASSSEEARRFGINTLCYHFDCYLNRPKDTGLVLIDRFDDKEIDGQLREKLSVGLTGHLPYSSEMKIQWIVGYHLAAIGQSHFCSLVDVLLGSLRFAINAFTRAREDELPTAKAILKQLAPLFWRTYGDRVSEVSLWFSPKDVRSDTYRSKYRALRDFLAENGVVASQAL